MTRLNLMILALVAASSIAAAQDVSTEAVPTVNYDLFMQTDVGTRVRLFNEATPEAKAEVARTHLRRWRDANRSHLNAEQVAVLEENLLFITASLFDHARSGALAKRAQRLAGRTEAVFTREEIRDALTIRGPYVPSVPLP